MKTLIHLASVLLICLTAGASKQPNQPAFDAAKKFMHGVNLANYLEVPPAQRWSVHHDLRDLEAIRAQGFDHVRIPICWHQYCGPAPDYKISQDIFGKADEIVTNATRLGLSVIINIHNFNEFTTDPVANEPWFQAIWKQVAAHYRKAPPGVAFELLNEPKDAATTEVMNSVYAKAIREIRKTNPRRIIFAGPGKWNSPSELPKFQLPDDKYLIVTLHCYDPFYFTHQGATWAGDDVKSLHGVQFPGPPQTPITLTGDHKKWVFDWIKRYNSEPTETNPAGPSAFVAKIQKAKVWSEQFKRPIHFGEFGAFTKADEASRAHYYAAMRKALDEAGFGWAIWDWKSGFNYVDRTTLKPLPGMREALFPSNKAGIAP